MMQEGERLPWWTNRFYAVSMVVLFIFVVVSVVVLSVQHAHEVDSSLYGHKFKRDHFYIPLDMLEINHGSYGATPKSVLSAEMGHAIEMERGTGKWFAGGLAKTAIDEARGTIANYVGANKSCLVFVTNVSSGLNAVLRSFRLTPGDVILMFQWEYPMDRYTSQWVASASGASVVDIPAPFPTTEEEIISSFEDAIAAQEGRVKLAVFDHIVSSPSLIMPVARLVEICKQHNITSIVDGAHAVGQLPLSLDKLGADVYTSNGHKWLCSGKGSAFLYVAPWLQPVVHPAIISNYFGQGFVTEFWWTGTRDYSAWLSMVDAISFRKTYGGEEAWMAYNNDLCTQVFDVLSEHWQVERPVPANMTASLLTMPLPCQQTRCDNLKIDAFQQWLRNVRNIWSVPFAYRGQFFVRFSCQVYNELSDYIAFADAFDEYLSDIH